MHFGRSFKKLLVTFNLIYAYLIYNRTIILFQILQQRSILPYFVFYINFHSSNNFIIHTNYCKIYFAQNWSSQSSITNVNKIN